MILNVAKLPVIIQAIQWTGDNLAEVLEFTGRHPRFDEWFSSFEEYAEFVKNDSNIFKIVSDHGNLKANVGDWIMRGVNGEHYPCADDVFQKTYAVIQDDIFSKFIADIRGLIMNIDRNRKTRQHSLAVTKLEEAKHWLQDTGN